MWNLLRIESCRRYRHMVEASNQQPKLILIVEKKLFYLQFESAYAPDRLCNWEVPKNHRTKPLVRKGSTKIVSNDRGHLLPGIPRFYFNSSTAEDILLRTDLVTLSSNFSDQRQARAVLFMEGWVHGNYRNELLGT